MERDVGVLVLELIARALLHLAGVCCDARVAAVEEERPEALITKNDLGRGGWLYNITFDSRQSLIVAIFDSRKSLFF